MDPNTTPKKFTGSNEIPPSPSSKRTLDFDYWAVGIGSSENKAQKRVKKDESVELKIKALSTGQYLEDALLFRVAMKKTFITEKESGTIRTLKLVGLDETGEIALVGFGATAEKFDKILEMNRCFKLVGFHVLEENEKYPNHTGHRFFIKLIASSDISEANIELSLIPFEFLQLNEVQTADKGAKIDILGVVVKNWGITFSGTSRRRYVTMVDHSGHVRVTLWNHAADEFGDDEKCILAIRRGDVEIFENMRHVNTCYYTTIWKNPEVESHSLQDWFEKKDKEREAQLLMLQAEASK